MRTLWLIGLTVWLWLGWGASLPADAAVAQPDQVPLTLELLQKQLKTPLQSDGVRLIDLRRFKIDLRSENGEFREQFYRQLQSQLRGSGAPLGLDLSYSIILGDLKMSELGLRSPLYGDAISPMLSDAEREQLQRDRRRLSQLSQLSRSLLAQAQPVPLQITVFRGVLNLQQTRFEGFVDFTNTFLLGRLDAQGADFIQDVDWSESRFGQPITFSGANFRREARFRNAIFFERATFNQAQFQGRVNFQSSEFQQTANFSQAIFQQTANLARIQWQNNADFAQTRWEGQALFNKDQFAQSLFLTEATFDKLVTFREAQFSQPVNLRSATILEQADFGDAEFSVGAYLNVSGLQFNSEQSRILGDPGRVGRVLSVPSLEGNETLLRNLVRNFRLLEQIPDANQVEYTREKLRLRDLRLRLLGTNINTASIQKLQQVGFTAEQIEVLVKARIKQPFRSLTDLLKLDGIDLATYVRVSDRLIARAPRASFAWLLDALHWVGLSLLLLLSRYGTSFWLVFGVGIVAIAYFGLLFWLVDRLRQLSPHPIRPTWKETSWVLGSFSLFLLAGFSAISRASDQPGLTLASLGLLVVPVPGLLLGLIYRKKRTHSLMNSSYFVEDAGLRQLRFLIGRLPIMPRYAFFRDRHMPILWERNWNWLNYYDFSLNNLFKFGFNDIRLRDEHIPGLITTLVWYQWGLGILYFTLLLWTLSRTIPGLNLLIYFK